MSDTKAILRSIFERHRKGPGPALTDEAFDGFLTGEPGGIRSLRNSFRGLHRLNAFYDDVQTTFGICLNRGDDEKNWSFAALAEHIDKKRTNKTRQARLVKERIEEQRLLMFDDAPKTLIFSLPVLGTPSLILWKKTGNPLLLYAFLIAAFLIAGFTVYVNLRRLRFYKQILDTMSQSSNDPAS